MTLQQLKYVTTIANIGSISEAAKRLFVSQPSFSIKYLFFNYFNSLTFLLHINQAQLILL